ncbi:uncharacterized protein L969DRAFT_74100 [Mixia osmundae IAM 14324]|uniref:N-acetyltransferase domain-containing protein n=1 Tax=Mixia osmundae (strain CBS 9802 / IAM 14324 / JCM 22182 / KY 12970) TaxID=764103 RepID=G7E8A2_MIXOS|nr:uncharacterized protein L969DRAFT_74100 [Mixia osmundae IAM 14324]KEI39165.1 hypothetical protein L969DRAFT_74100 [Mixia osmundae IAM 14324]GAA99062.1 hypothetical protein E5Q_05751 [Mixia osmundae IAM 14324]
MSAYGDIDGPSSASRLSPKTFALARSDACVTVYHLLKGDLRQDASLVSYLREIFNSVVEAGQTYPQEAQQSEEQFANYFFSADLFLGVFDNASPERASRSWQEVSALRDWPGTVAGMYYVKPNYPGRSAHICNAGFVVPTASRGRKVGLALGRSFLHFAPRLGFRASVFNLCYSFFHARRMQYKCKLEKYESKGEAIQANTGSSLRVWALSDADMHSRVHTVWTIVRIPRRPRSPISILSGLALL